MFALQEAGSPRYTWSSSVIVSTLVLSSVCWLAFLAWIAWLSLGNKTFRMRAILPLHVLISRPTGPAIVSVALMFYPCGTFADQARTIFLTGFPYFIAIINLPQRFQIVNGNSPIEAGVRLLPLLCSMALGKFESRYCLHIVNLYSNRKRPRRRRIFGNQKESYFSHVDRCRLLDLARLWVDVNPLRWPRISSGGVWIPVHSGSWDWLDILFRHNDDDTGSRTGRCWYVDIIIAPCTGCLSDTMDRL